MAIDSRRRWLVPVAILLLLALGLLLREGRKASNGAIVVVRNGPSPIDPPTESVAEKARRAAVAAQGPVKRNGVNAADLYKEALGLYAELTDAEKNMIAHWRDKPDPKKAAALYARIQPIMNLLRAARKADYADWGMERLTFSMENISAKGGQISKEMDLGALGFWESTYRFQSDPDGAVGDLAATDAMGRSTVDSLIGLLVEISIHSSAITITAENAGGITSAASPDLEYIVSSGAAEQNFRTAMNDEASILQAQLDEFANPATRNESYIQKYSNPGAMSEEEIASETEWSMQTEQSLATTLTESDAQFQQWWNQKLAESASMPLTTAILPSLARARSGSQMSMVQNAMLEAGLALEQNNSWPDQGLIEIALDGQPFTYTQTAEGFQLTSPSPVGKNPVTLAFPAPPAK